MQHNILGLKKNKKINIRLDKIRAFDYVKDLQGNIYVIRGFTKEANNIIVKPIYLSKNDKLIKYVRKLEHIKLAIPKHCGWADCDNYIMTHDDVHNIFPRNKLLLKECHCGSKLLNEIDDFISHHNAKCYLFGSKRLPNGYINPVFLEKIFPKTTAYFKTKSSEIGLFFASDTDSIIPNIDNDYFFAKDYCEGTILASDGSSYLMPRRFSIECRKGKIKNIITPIWELGGIEECFDFKVSIEGLLKLSDDTFWLGGKNTSLRLINE